MLIIKQLYCCNLVLVDRYTTHVSYFIDRFFNDKNVSIFLGWYRIDSHLIKQIFLLNLRHTFIGYRYTINPLPISY